MKQYLCFHLGAEVSAGIAGCISEGLQSLHLSAVRWGNSRGNITQVAEKAVPHVQSWTETLMLPALNQTSHPTDIIVWITAEPGQQHWPFIGFPHYLLGCTSFTKINLKFSFSWYWGPGCNQWAPFGAWTVSPSPQQLQGITGTPGINSRVKDPWLNSTCLEVEISFCPVEWRSLLHAAQLFSRTFVAPAPCRTFLLFLLLLGPQGQQGTNTSSLPWYIKACDHLINERIFMIPLLGVSRHVTVFNVRIRNAVVWGGEMTLSLFHWWRPETNDLLEIPEEECCRVWIPMDIYHILG